jgi:Glycosyltransferases involved in cell wall biogenesis
MTTYNGEKYVGEQIDSILASTYQDFELFIFDDGSKDHTMSVLEEYERNYPDKIHVSQNKINLGVTLNFLSALSRTTMDYIMFCDQDDVWMKQKITLTLKRMRHMEAQIGKENPLAVFTDACVVDQDLNEINRSFFRTGHLNPQKTDLSHILMENKLIGCTVMMNAALRRILQSNRLPESARYHDWWIALIAASFGKIGFINEATLYYRQHEDNVVGGAGFCDYMKNRLKSLKNQKEAIRKLERQAGEFIDIYGEILSDQNREIIQTFSNLDELSFLKKKKTWLYSGFRKSGLVRNLGVFFII